jgi:5'-3' exonuclease
VTVHLVDGTYELFRHFYAVPSVRDGAGNEVGAVGGVLASMLGLLESGATHVGVATDHVIESFRNRLYPGYKTGDGIAPDLLAQFRPLELALVAAGIEVWPMIEHEADDALATAAALAARDARVERVFLCTPDKDLAQCVGGRVVQLDRRQRTLRDADGVREKFGVEPASIPDYLALVGDSADGFPGIRGFGPKSAATILARYGHLESIPDDASAWDVEVRGAARLAAALAASREEARLFRELATLRTDASVSPSVDALEWKGPTEAFRPLAAHMGMAELAARAESIAGGRS